MRHSGRNAAFPWPANPQSRSLLTLGSTQAVSAQSDAGRKKSTQKPGPPPAQHVAAPGRSELSGFHSTSRIRKSGELGANSLVTERGVGVGLPTPPAFHSGGPRIFSTHYAQPCGKILGGEQKILPRCISSRIFSGEREMHSRGLRKFLPPPGDKDRVQREHFIGSTLGRPKSSPSSVCGAGGRSQAVGAPSSALDQVHFQPPDTIWRRA